MSSATFGTKPPSDFPGSSTPGGRILNYANLVAYIINTAITFSVGQTPLFGPTNADISAKYPTLFTPATFAFGIWGLIFTWELAFVIYQLLPQVRDKPIIQKGVGPYWILMSIFQIGWTLTFTKEWIQTSMAFMLGIFGCLVAIVLNLNKNTQTVRGTGTTTSVETFKDYAFVYLPFSINLAWIVAATIVNANVVAVYRDSKDVTTQLAIAVLSFFLFGLTAVFGGVTLKDPAFSSTLVWAGLGVAFQLEIPFKGISKNFPDFVTSALARSAVALSTLAGVATVGSLTHLIMTRSGGAKQLVADAQRQVREVGERAHNQMRKTQ